MKRETIVNLMAAGTLGLRSGRGERFGRHVQRSLAIVPILGLSLSAITAVGCGADKIVVSDEIAAEWASVATSHGTITNKPAFDQSDAAAFVSTKLLNAGFDAVEGTVLRPDPKANPGEDAELKVNAIDLATAPGSGSVQLSLTAHSPKRDVTVKLTGDAFLVMKAFVPSAETGKPGTLTVGLRVLRIDPQITWGGWLDSGASNAFVQRLAAIGLHTAVGNLEVSLPVPDTIALPYALDKTETSETKKGDKVIGTITWRATNAGGTAFTRLQYQAPLVTSKGLWLMFDENAAEAGGFSATLPPNLSGSAARAEIEKMRAAIRAAEPAYELRGADLALFLNERTLRKVVEKIGQLPAEARIVRIQSTARTGMLHEEKWHDDVLGDGGFFVELAGDDALSGGVNLGVPQAAFQQGTGLKIALPIDAKVAAAIHAHVDPLIGGGVGPTFGMDGSAIKTFQGTIDLRMLDVTGHRVAAFVPTMSDGSVRITLQTDGKFKTDFGWTKVPSIGATFAQDLAPDGLGAIKVVDDIPARFMRADSPTTDWPTDAVDVHVTSLQAETRADGFLIGVNVGIKAANGAGIDPYDGERKALDQAVATLRFRDPAAKKDDFFAITAGGVEFGPNNEIVKFLVSIGKLTQQFADFVARAPNEVSPEKIKGWVQDPVGSIQRGELGKVAGNVANDITHGPGDSNDLVGKDGWTRKRLGF